jgi:hypothetical protein
VACKHNVARPLVHGKIVFHRIVVLTNVHGDDHQPVTGEIPYDAIDRSLLAAAYGSPGGPELQQHHLPPQRVIREGLAPKRVGGKLRRGVPSLGQSQCRKNNQKQ